MTYISEHRRLKWVLIIGLLLAVAFIYLAFFGSGSGGTTNVPITG